MRSLLGRLVALNFGKSGSTDDNQIRKPELTDITKHIFNEFNV